MHPKIKLELLLWLFTFLFVALFIVPIYLKCEKHYSFYISNIISILVFGTLTRIIFLLKYTPYARSKWLRMVLIFLPIPFLMYQVDSLFEFQKFVDEEGTIKFFGNSFDIHDYEFGRYIKYQFIFFCVGAIVTLVLLPMRMIISFWRTTNTQDNV